MSTRRTALAAGAALTAACTALGISAPTLAAGTAEHYNVKTPTSVGYGGAVTSVDPEATKVGIEVLRAGGNAVDAAVATAAALGVTEPYSSGIGGGGYFVYYDAARGSVETIDGRETAPMSMPEDAFVNPKTGEPYRFTPELVTSGVSVGTPGTLATWDRALKRWGSRSLAQTLAPASALARRGFLVDRTFHDQTEQNRERFSQFPDTAALFLPRGKSPAVGSVLRNPDLADTYDLIGRQGIAAFYRGPLAAQIAQTAQHPPKKRDATLPVPPGYLETSDLAAYRAIDRRPTHVDYRGLDVYGMGPSASGGTTVGEALNILENYDLAGMDTAAALHHYLEASALAFADRGHYVGDPAYVDVPRDDLLSDTYAEERACQLDEHHAAEKPVPYGDVTDYDGRCDTAQRPGSKVEDNENVNTTNLTVADKWGNVVEYTLTIEQTGGSGITVPGRGFLLNNELTDFSYDDPPADDPNQIEGGKRPRSSISPTIVLKDGEPFVAVGSPGGSTIITTVLQILFNRIDRGMTLPQAVKAPRASQRNTPTVTAEPTFIDRYQDALEPYGHVLAPAGDAFTLAAQIGAATAIEFGPGGQLTAVSEPKRRGGGSALVVNPSP